MKRLNIILLASVLAMLSPHTAGAQKSVGTDEAAKMVQEIVSTTSRISSISCNFVQTKTIVTLDSKVVSKGRMSFSRPADIRWEYTEPHRYAMVMHDGIATIESPGRKEVIDTRKNKVFQQICDMMLSSVTGDCLSNPEQFSVTMMKQDKLWLAVLLPMKKEMKQFLYTVTLYYDPEAGEVVKVEMKENTGDTTLIQLNDIRHEIAE